MVLPLRVCIFVFAYALVWNHSLWFFINYITIFLTGFDDIDLNHFCVVVFFFIVFFAEQLLS